MARFIDRSERRHTRENLRKIANTDFGTFLMDAHEGGHDLGLSTGPVPMRGAGSIRDKKTKAAAESLKLTPEQRAAAVVAAHKAANGGRLVCGGKTFVNGIAVQADTGPAGPQAT